MNTYNLTNSEKEIYQQPVVKVIAIQAGRSILQDSVYQFGGDEIQ